MKSPLISAAFCGALLAGGAGSLTPGGEAGYQKLVAAHKGNVPFGGFLGHVVQAMPGGNAAARQTGLAPAREGVAHRDHLGR